MKLLRNIRSKIWACFSVGLISYLLATLATTWVNNETKISITHIQETDLPLTFKGIRVHSLFNAQSDDYENGLLTGEPGEVQRANMRHDRIAGLLDEMARLAGEIHTDIYPRILTLRDDYNEYFTLASLYYMEAVRKGDMFAAGREIHLLGRLQAGLDADFQQVADILQSMIVTDLGKNTERLDLYTRLLQIFFVLFLIGTAIVTNWLANREIIAPLDKIKTMISTFALGGRIGRPLEEPAGDEIRELATSFWQMTQDLQHITAARDYVDKIINNMSDPLIILNPDLSIQAVNRAALNLLRLTDEELVGRSFREVFSHEKEAVADALFQELLEGKPVNNLEALYVDCEGNPFPVLFSAGALYTSNGNLEGISCLAREISEFKEQRDQLEFLANFDTLTGLPNRNLFFDRLTMALNEARRYGHIFALLYLDLDRFKPLNDRYGHEAGDLALQETARRLKSTVRNTDTVSRIGGDEFTVLLSRIQGSADATQVATKILDTFIRPVLIHGTEHTLGVSIGICLSSPDITDADVLLKNADTAMYAAKAQGRNRFMLSSPDLME